MQLELLYQYPLLVDYESEKWKSVKMNKYIWIKGGGLIIIVGPRLCEGVLFLIGIILNFEMSKLVQNDDNVYIMLPLAGRLIVWQ